MGGRGIERTFEMRLQGHRLFWLTLESCFSFFFFFFSFEKSGEVFPIGWTSLTRQRG